MVVVMMDGYVSLSLYIVLIYMGTHLMRVSCVARLSQPRVRAQILLLLVDFTLDKDHLVFG